MPDTYITRQEMAVMIKRAIDAVGIQYTPADGILSVLDHGKVDTWAVAGVDFNFEKCCQYSTFYGGALNVQQYSIVSTGSYLGYLAVETLPWGASKM